MDQLTNGQYTLLQNSGFVTLQVFYLSHQLRYKYS